MAIESPSIHLTVSPEIWGFGTSFQLELVRVPAGEFLMGTDPAKDNFSRPDEFPLHSVGVSEFYISKYEVTNTEYAAYARANGILFEFPAGRDEHPAVHEAWHQAVAFCKWVSDIIGREVRLPTEAEWEKAARGTDVRLYPWGNNWEPESLNCALGIGGETTPVTEHSPAGDSPYGVADTAGNVWEWVADWYDENTYADRVKSGLIVTDPTGPVTGTHRVLRGGSYYFRQGGTRAARRFKYIPASRCYDIGFRVVVSFSSPPAMTS